MPRSEAEILARLRRGKTPGLKRGIGDDCAIYQPKPGEDLVFTTDFLIENVHFTRATHPPRSIGHKALARGLSDIAAMGADPRFCLLSLALPEWATTRFIDALFDGLQDLAAQTRCPLAGGDLSHAPLLLCDIVVCGSVPTSQALLRSAAQPGDGIWVSGSLGGSSLGRRTQSGRARRKHLYPDPRLVLGRALRNIATSAMDLSDGLSLDLARLCTESRVAAAITTPPIFPGATIDDALHGGEDYELLFTLPASKHPKAIAGILVTRIGSIVSGVPGYVTLDGMPLAPLAYDHFRNRS
jgi:thiamine-monophosphate kinase